MGENMAPNKEQEASADAKSVPKGEPESDAKRASVASTDEDDSPSAKRQRQEIVDLAQTLFLKDEDRLEVLWDIEGKERWWSAKLLPFDGRSDEGVAIRSLLYDAWPEGGFPEPSKEDVMFLGRDLIMNYPSQEELNFRILSEDNSEVVWVSEVDTMVNSILDAAIKKSEASFVKLPRAQQAMIAEKIAKKKNRLIELLEQHIKEQREKGNLAVVTADDAKTFLDRALTESDSA